MAKFEKVLTGFNQYPKQNCYVSRPEAYRDLLAHNSLMIARGQGASYGDAALNESGQVILTERLNRFVDFDADQGILTAEAGATLAEILDFIIPQGWFLPVTPGTQYVSLGGCIAADVHGKNHHHVGTFGQHVISFELIKADGSSIHCSLRENTDVFWATIGGMGLTGIIGTVSLKLIPITSSYMLATHYATRDLEQTLEYLIKEEKDDQYSIAWFDGMNQPFGRGVVMNAHHVEPQQLSVIEKKSPLFVKTKKSLVIPFNVPKWVLNKTLMKIYYERYYRQQTQHVSSFITSYHDYFYPLDSIKHWNRLYGKRGFIQYQCVLPTQGAYESIVHLLNSVRSTPYPMYLGTIKRFGAENHAPLSFPMAGYTIALDFPFIDAGLLSVLDKLDEIVIQYGGRVYLAKDVRLKPETFRAMYPRYAEWLAVKKKVDPDNVFSSSLARRLGIC